MKKWFMLLLACVLVVSACGCSKEKDKTVLDEIRNSSVAKLELPDGASTIVDSQIASIRSFADLDIMPSPLEPPDNEEDWQYRIIFNPVEKVTNGNEIVVSFHKDYIQIDSEYYLANNGVLFDSILEWVKSKFDGEYPTPLFCGGC